MKIKVGVLFGGKSAEHEVSIQSARNVVEAIDRSKYEVVPICIDKGGKWNLMPLESLASHGTKYLPLDIKGKGRENFLVPQDEQGQIVSKGTGETLTNVDVIFPILHGPFGEDGTVQGLCRLANVPYIGADVLGSAIGMDKDVMKRLLRDAGIRIAHFIVLDHRLQREVKFSDVKKELGLPFFIKPANMGSSVGVHKITSERDFTSGLEDAFHYDHKVIAEEFIKGREIECAVLGNEIPQASVLGEIIPKKEFYSYEAKYLDDDGADFKIPAKLPDRVAAEIQKIAVKAFRVLCCEGMARVDFFLTEKDEVYLNEINTIPGFTKISMYPKMWEASGVSYGELIDKLIQLAIARHKRDQRLKISR